MTTPDHSEVTAQPPTGRTHESGEGLRAAVAEHLHERFAADHEPHWRDMDESEQADSIYTDVARSLFEPGAPFAASEADRADECPFCKSDPEALADAHGEGWRAGREVGRREAASEADRATAGEECQANSPSEDWVPGVWADHEHRCVTHARDEHECACGAKWEIDPATPPTADISSDTGELSEEAYALAASTCCHCAHGVAAHNDEGCCFDGGSECDCPRDLYSAILGSDWLRNHDAAAATKARAEERERIAQAIEATEGAQSPYIGRPYYLTAARIARGEP